MLRVIIVQKFSIFRTIIEKENQYQFELSKKSLERFLSVAT
jgi:hypothetical protein